MPVALPFDPPDEACYTGQARALRAAKQEVVHVLSLVRFVL